MKTTIPVFNKNIQRQLLQSSGMLNHRCLVTQLLYAHLLFVEPTRRSCQCQPTSKSKEIKTP